QEHARRVVPEDCPRALPPVVAGCAGVLEHGEGAYSVPAGERPGIFGLLLRHTVPVGTSQRVVIAAGGGGRDGWSGLIDVVRRVVRHVACGVVGDVVRGVIRLVGGFRLRRVLTLQEGERDLEVVRRDEDITGLAALGGAD